MPRPVSVTVTVAQSSCEADVTVTFPLLSMDCTALSRRLRTTW